jgi:diacylglycerol kinase (ATP)
VTETGASMSGDAGPERAQTDAEGPCRSAVVVGGGCRGASPGRVEALRRMLAEAGEDFALHTTDSAEESTALAREAASVGSPRVWAAGGDGTVDSVIEGLAGTRTALAVVPFGTGNVLVRQLGISPRWPQAVRQQLEGRVTAIDLGICNGRLFCLFVGMGLDEAVVSRTEPRLKRVIGRSAFALSAVLTLVRYRPFAVRLEADGETVEADAWQVLICNGDLYGGGVRPIAGADPADGLLDAMVVPTRAHGGVTRLGFALSAVRSILGPPGFGRARVVRAKRLRVTTDPPVGVQVDGDQHGTTPVQIEVMPGALFVIVPPARGPARGSE